MTSVLHLLLPLNCQGQMALGLRAGVEHLLGLKNEITDQHDPMVQLNEPDDEGVIASLDDRDAMEEDVKASRGLSVLLGEEN